MVGAMSIAGQTVLLAGWRVDRNEANTHSERKESNVNITQF